jgi:hypothetical protein
MQRDGDYGMFEFAGESWLAAQRSIPRSTAPQSLESLCRSVQSFVDVVTPLRETFAMPPFA